MRRIKPDSIALFLLLSLMHLCRNFLWLIPSALMGPVMRDLGLNYTQSGYLLMIVTLMMGIFLLLGSGLLSVVPPAAAMIIGML